MKVVEDRQGDADLCRLLATRVTKAFSRKVTNHAAMVELFFMLYNLSRVHQALRVTPAMLAGVSDQVWEIEEIVRLLETTK